MTAPTPKKQKTQRKRPLIINLFTLSCVSHLSPGSWAHPKDESHTYNKISYWTKLAELAERGKANIFVADVLGPLDVYQGPRNLNHTARGAGHFPLIDPSAFVSASAAVSKSVGFGITFSTISEAPYHFARRLATLDSLTEGRIAWNIVTSYLDSASRNLLNGEELLTHDERYEKAEEYINVVYDLLLSSWRDDAVVKDVEGQTYADPDRIRETNFNGKYFTVPGPAVSEPTPQRFPLIIQAGTSSKGVEFAAKHAELIFINGNKPEDLKTTIDSIKKIASEKHGRNPDNLRFIVSIIAIIGETQEEADAKAEDYRKYFNQEGALALFSGQSGIDLSIFGDDEDLRSVDEGNSMKSAVKRMIKDSTTKKTKYDIANEIGVSKGNKKLFVGTVKSVADTIEDWVEKSGIDGFNFASVNFPQTHTDVVDLLLPELRRRGLASDDYAVPGGTFRENIYGIKGQTFLPEDHPAYKLRWTEGTKEEFTKKVQAHKLARGLK